MKKIILFIVISLVWMATSTAQEKLSDTEKLASLGKVYGFLKYYHPKVAKGYVNVDQHLVEHISKVKSTTDKASLSKIYIDWIDELGEIVPCKSCNEEKPYFDKNFDLSWLDDTRLFTAELSSKLRYIEQNRNQEANYYIEIKPVGNIKVTNEPTYKALGEYPQEVYRLLGLFKYWNIIEYFFPYKYLTDQHWDAVLLEMIPKFQQAANKTDYQNTIKELVAKLDDSHAWISITQENVKHLPVKISNIEDKAVISGFYNDSIAKQNDLQLGDIIVKINDVVVASEMAKRLKYTAGSNTNGKIKRTYSYIFAGVQDEVVLTIIRNGSEKQITSKRYHFKDFNYLNNPKTIKSKSISDDIGYINAGSVDGKEVFKIFKSFKNKKAVIIDVRNYPKPIHAALTRFTNSEKRDFYNGYSPDISYPGKFIYKQSRKTGGSRKNFKGKVIILVNEETISLAEFIAMALQTGDNVITVGNQTVGADGDVVTFNYLGGYKTAMSGNGIQYPDGTETQRKGVKTDVEVTPTINGLQQGRDEVLEKAIEIATEKK
ncbi:MAG: S41 family peptidase [Bacteroidota bacterium]